jgi:hypothetical protein
LLGFFALGIRSHGQNELGAAFLRVLHCGFETESDVGAGRKDCFASEGNVRVDGSVFHGSAELFEAGKMRLRDGRRLGGGNMGDFRQRKHAGWTGPGVMLVNTMRCARWKAKEASWR